nr:hypothetical protein BaRGS_019523 [Batillaria attramentaria]
MDPVVVEDIGIPNVLSFPPPPPVTGESEPSPPEMSSRIVVPAKRTHAEMEGAMGMGPGRMVQRSFVNPRHSFAQQARGMRRGFDFNRLGGFNRQQYKHENTTLEVRKIPAEFNTIAKLNEHFGKFGNLTNIQVKFSGDPCAALISYSRNEEAARAYHSSEPVFNNRFIKLFWHRPSQTPGDANAGGEQSTSIVYTTSMGNLKKTVFNQGMTKARATVAAMTSPTGVKPADFVTRIEAIKKSEEMKKEAIVKKAELDKQKQVLLEKQISQQKMLKVVSDSIDKLKFSGAPGPKKLAPAGSLRLVNTPPASSSATSPAATVTRRLSGGSTPALLQQTKKEILDTELDLMTKASSGEDTTPLRRKLVELTQQLGWQFV